MELITIKNENGKQLVSARELYEKLEISERFSKWFERMVGYGFVENEDYTPYQMVHPQNKQEITDYVLTLDASKQICMLQRSEIGTKFRLYFIECEKKLNNIQPQKKSLDTPYDYLDNNAQALNGFLATMGLNIPKEIVAHTVVLSAQKQTGYDFDEVKQLLNKQEEEIYHTKKEVCMRAGIKGNKVNATLDALGLQVEGSSSMQPWCLTELGKTYGVERAYSSGGHQGYEIKFKESTVDFIKQNLHLIPRDWIK